MNRKTRPIRIEGDVAYVPLTKGYEAIIDAEDVPLVEGFNWHALEDLCKNDGSVRNVYAARNARISDGVKGAVRMHRVIAGTPEGMDTDHRDGNGLNNRRGNLRSATRRQNRQNSRMSVANKAGLKGVWPVKNKNAWRASITFEGQQRNLGRFKCRTAAAIAYAVESKRLFGEFSRIS
jgi:hypothetical protein